MRAKQTDTQEPITTYLLLLLLCGRFMFIIFIWVLQFSQLLREMSFKLVKFQRNKNKKMTTVYKYEIAAFLSLSEKEARASAQGLADVSQAGEELGG